MALSVVRCGKPHRMTFIQQVKIHSISCLAQLIQNLLIAGYQLKAYTHLAIGTQLVFLHSLDPWNRDGLYALSP
jgi:hypothetical protein